MSRSAGTGSGGGISVENGTDERRVVEIGPIGGDTTERTVEPRGAFVWGETPDDRFDLEVSTDEHWAVVEVDAGTDPNGITVRLTRSGVVVDHPGDVEGPDDTPNSEHDPTGDVTTDDPWGDGAESASERGIDLLGGGSPDETTSGPESPSSRSPPDSRHGDGSDDDAVSRSGESVDTSSPGASTSSGGAESPHDPASPGSESTSESQSPSSTSHERERVPEADTDDDETEHASQSDTRGDETHASPGTDTNGVAETPSEPASRTAQSAGTDAAAEATTAVADPDAPTPDAAREAFERTTAIDERLDELERRAVWLDEEFRIPLTNTRVGVSSIVGLLPGAGDGLMFLVALSLVYHGLRLGAPTRTLLWMSVVLTVEFAVSVVPVVGDLVGLLWSANVQNVGYLRANRESLDGSTNWVFVLLLCSPWIVTLLAVVSLL
ncbi:DUF4112 domain-containing protein [Halobaculum sp. MBLA0147]|uniref:DUF4112 domain-containing protein n=1 Tax=Halobaculum sp. MBLA0147 TaxID=3079934 RepID=UPI0035242E6B